MCGSCPCHRYQSVLKGNLLYVNILLCSFVCLLLYLAIRQCIKYRVEWIEIIPFSLEFHCVGLHVHVPIQALLISCVILILSLVDLILSMRSLSQIVSKILKGVI